MIGWVAISLVMAATVATLATAPVPGALVVLQLRMSGGQAKAGCCYSANSGLIGWMLLLDMAFVTMDYLGDKMEIKLWITIEKIDHKHVRSRYALGCFLCLCFGPVGPLFWFVVAGALTKRSNFEVGACSIYGIISTFSSPKKRRRNSEKERLLRCLSVSLFLGGMCNLPCWQVSRGLGIDWGMHYCKPREVRENLPQEAQVARRLRCNKVGFLLVDLEVVCGRWGGLTLVISSGCLWWQQS